MKQCRRTSQEVTLRICMSDAEDALVKAMWKSCKGESPMCYFQLVKVAKHNDNDNDNDNDTLREVPHPSNEGLALQARVSGP